jgi:hypothetical protein
MLLFVHGFQQKTVNICFLVVLIITTNLLFVCHLFNFWFSSDFICETSQATASTYSLCRLGESCVANYVLCRGVGGPSHTYSCIYTTGLSSVIMFFNFCASYHSFQSELSSTSGLTVLFFKVLCSGPVREYNGLTINMLQTDCTFLPQCHASIISTPDLRIICPD